MITWFDIVAILSTVRGASSDNLLTVEDSVGGGPIEARPGGNAAATTATMCSGPARAGSEPSGAGMNTGCHAGATMSPSSSVSVGAANTAATPVTMCSGPRRQRSL
jgi:hypothetical protein